MASASNGKKVHETPVALLHDELSNPGEWREGLIDARLFNISVRSIDDLGDVKNTHDLHIVLLGAWSGARAESIQTLATAVRRRHGVVLVVGKDLEQVAVLEALRMGADAVLPAELGPRRLYRRVAYFLQRMRRQAAGPISVVTALNG